MNGPKQKLKKSENSSQNFSELSLLDRTLGREQFNISPSKLLVRTLMLISRSIEYNKVVHYLVLAGLDRKQ